MHPVRRAAALAGVTAVLALPVLGLSTSGASADPTPSPTLLPIPTRSATPAPTRSAAPTHSPTPKPSPTATHTATPSPTPRHVRRTSSPAPRVTTQATQVETPTDAGTPVTTSLPVGALDLGTPDPTPTTKATKKATVKAAASGDDSHKYTEIGGLVIGAAVLLGLGGGAGLYLTRHHT